jgi:hypothetical protein
MQSKGCVAKRNPFLFAILESDPDCPISSTRRAVTFSLAGRIRTPQPFTLVGRGIRDLGRGPAAVNGGFRAMQSESGRPARDPLLSFERRPVRQLRSEFGPARVRPELTVLATLRSPRCQRYVALDDRSQGTAAIARRQRDSTGACAQRAGRIRESGSWNQGIGDEPAEPQPEPIRAGCATSREQTLHPDAGTRPVTRRAWRFPGTRCWLDWSGSSRSCVPREDRRRSCTSHCLRREIAPCRCSPR